MMRKRASILIVEDNVVDRAHYERLLARNAEYNFDISHCEMGEDALALCRHTPPDCVLLDYHLPDIDGIEFLLAIHHERPDGVMPTVVMITGQGELGVAVDAIRHGASDYLVKDDVDEVGLNRAIQLALNTHHSVARDCIGRHTVLVVDDNAHDRELYKRLLQEASHSRFDVVEVACGTEALASIAVRRPACILLDYNLPDYDGLELLDALHYEYKKHGLASPVILMLTGQGIEPHAVASIKRGANDYLVKGAITREVLKQSVVSALEFRDLQEKMHGVRKEFEVFTDTVSQSLDVLLNSSLENCESAQNSLKGGDARSAQALACVHDNLACMQYFSHELAAIRHAVSEEGHMFYRDLSALLESVVNELRKADPSANVNVLLSAQYHVSCNAKLIGCLLKNAMAFFDGETLNVEVERGDAMGRVALKISPASSVVGVAPQADTMQYDALSSSVKNGRKGLYLALCRKIMDYHDGRIYLEHDDQRNGKIMHCWL